MKFEISVNGLVRKIDVDPSTPLVWILRDELELTGTKFGCGVASCGNCTVHINGKAARSCQMKVDQLADAEITTIEGIASPEGLHPIQEAFLENAALQCGICTPGFIVATKALLDHNPNPSEYQIRFWLANNLCRCTGYDKIVLAVQDAASRLSASKN